ncbi:MAG: hypothetical protein O3C29_14300 [Proteobacteria bacterium]|nr:hypothetical protein [Pseudomonadota bacterium]MDA1291887.1 hypothetical protein [Pseudomonadota bacterium]
MNKKLAQFIVDPHGKAPQNLKDSILKIRNASAEFCSNWTEGRHHDAQIASDEAFKHFDYVQGELLRQRDFHKKNQATWPSSAFKIALNKQVGIFLDNISTNDISGFKNYAYGEACMPANSNSQLLSLERALNKLKHRDTISVNFAMSPSSGHTLYVLTFAGMGQPASLAEIKISNFCDICDIAASHV